MQIIADTFGIIGVILILVSYILLQTDRINSSSLLYSLINLLGAILILFSLYYSWNLASFIIEIFWILISLYGIWKNLRGKRVTTDTQRSH
ncbi:MAG: hypothetical protein KBF93_15540 [Leptospiraceae bacterium]|nr:hypothetical protein [Leptospiraceae bacterium]